MATLGFTFKPEETESVSFESLPPGTYEAEVLETEVKNTKDGNGTLLVVTWRVISGEHENRRIWQNLNIQNNSAAAQKIGQGQLKAICEALGIDGHMEDSDALHGGQAIINVGMGKAQNGYEAKPEVKSVKPFAAQPPAGKPAPQNNAAAQKPAEQRPAPAQQRTAAPAQPQRPAGGRPWANRATA